MIPKPLDEIERADVEALVTSQAKELRTLEYKQTLKVGPDNERKEFLADVSSFANAAGGDLLFGVEEERDANGKPTGIPKSVPGIAMPNEDAIILQLEGMIRDGIKPRMTVQFHTVKGFPAGPVLLLRIPKSWASPHMVTLKETSRFYSRTSKGKYQLDVQEIRAAFVLSESLPERVRRFRDERIARIVADETPVSIPANYARLVLHVLPVVSFGPVTPVDISAVGRDWRSLRPPGPAGHNCRFNVDGFLVYTQMSIRDPVSFHYTQMFRSGGIECVQSISEIPEKPGPAFGFGQCERDLIEGLSRYVTLQQEIGLPFPTIVLLTITGMRGFQLVTSMVYRDHPLYGNCYIDRDVLLLPDVVVQDEQPADQILRPIFDAVWQSSGWPGCPNYDDKGRWK